MSNTLLLVGVAALGYYLYNQKENDGGEQNKFEATAATEPKASEPKIIKPVVVKVIPGSIVYPSGYPIVYGKYNANAKPIQRALGVKQDGIIGKQTLALLKKYWPVVTERTQIGDEKGLKIVVALITSARGVINFLK